jgi:DeoR/GlpR family transcriptional regulator of sugar metabolism
MEGLLKEERQQQILAALQENKRVTVPELSRRFGISEVTVRRDLADLAAGGRLIRTHRGALIADPAPPEPPVVQRMGLQQAAKEMIARAATHLVSDGDTIFIGSGSTMACFARQLAPKKRLTIITNALNIAIDLAGLEGDRTVVVLGGVLRTDELSLVGHLAEQSLAEIRFQKIFMGVQALSIEGGWTTDHLPEVSTTRRFLQPSPDLIVLADGSKLGQTAAALIAPLTRIHTLVTDSSADSAFLTQARTKGLSIIVA